MLITDGQLHELLTAQDTVLITDSDFEIGLIDFEDDYYFQTQNFRKFLRKTSLTLSINPATIERLKKDIKIRGYLSPAIFSELNQLEGNNYKYSNSK